MRLDIRYSTRFEYAAPVRESCNELRACPASDERQTLISYRVDTDPASRVRWSTDYWGTRVDSFSIREPHEALEIVAHATVETTRAPLLTSSPALGSVRDEAFVEAHVEYLQPSPYVAWGPAVAQEARRRADALGDDLVSVVLALHRAAGTTLSYQPGTTEVGTPVDEVLARGRGVCQDFAHLVVALCRSQLIPARYVSGYLFTADEATGAEVTTDTVTVQTHAWIEAAIPGHGWWALDPTNGLEVGERHVKIGHGRDYGDVPPLRGAFSGPPEHDLDVAVEMRRLEAASSAQQ